MWSDLAHEMTAEFRGLCAEEVRYPNSISENKANHMTLFVEGSLYHNTCMVCFCRHIYSKSLKNFMI